MKINFDYFQIQKWILQTVRVKKVDKKYNEIICLVLMFSSWVMALKFGRKVHFLQIFAEFSKKPKSVKEIFILHHYTLSGNDMVYRGLSHRSWDILDIKKDAESVEI